MLKKISLVSLLLTTSLFSFERASVGLNINQDDVEFEARSSVEYFTDVPEYKNFFIDANYLNAKENLYGLGISAENSPINYQNLLFSIGLRGVHSSHNDDSMTAMPIVVGMKARLGFSGLPETYFGIKAGYSPSVLTFQDGENYKEMRAELDTNIIPNVNVYIGARKIDTNYKAGDFRLDNKAYAGFKFVLDPR